MEVAVYGLPVRMPHWSFGVRYIYQLIQHRMGHSRMFEVVFPGNPGQGLSRPTATACRKTRWSPRTCSATRISRRTTCCSSAARSRSATTSSSRRRPTRTRSSRRSRSHGQKRVEQVLDAALALEPHIDIDQALRRRALSEVRREPRSSTRDDPFRRRFADLPGERPPADAPPSARARRFRRSPSPISCGSSRTTRPRWRTGSATSSSPCARNRSISIRYSRARS